MTYSETIEWLFEQFPAYHNLGEAAYNPGLKNTEELATFFGNPHQNLRFIHIGGTNGKGSTANMIASVLKESGENVGLFTSPHILDFTERIRINGKMIDPNFVIEFCEKVKTHSWTIQPSFFEMTWVMALCYFQQEKCSVVVAEVGLGGRLDATNIITPLLSIITNIGLDHTHILGKNRATIAMEKAGIIKRTIPVILGEIDAETFPVFEQKATEQNAVILPLLKIDDTPPSIQGYQHLNFRIARTAFHYLQHNGFSITEENIDLGTKRLKENTGFFGRFEIKSQNPKLIFDCAHNTEGIEVLLEHVLREEGELFIVYGTSSDKDLKEIQKILPKDAHYFITSFKNSRSAKVSDLKIKFKDFGKSRQFFAAPEEALKTAQEKAGKKDTLLVFGSFFMIQEIISLE